MYKLESVLNLSELTAFTEFLQRIGAQPSQVISLWESRIRNRPALDIAALDDLMAASDPDYDNEQCTFLGREVSMAEYVREKHGQKIHDIINKLL